MTPQRIVVTGGSGFVGRALCERLAQVWPGCRVVVPTRRMSRARTVQLLPNVDVIEADVHRADEALQAFEGADALVQLVAILHGSTADFERNHVALQRTLAQAAQKAGIGRVVQVSALGVAHDAPSAYLRSKAAGEGVWRQAAQVSDSASALTPRPLDVRVLRPSVIFGAYDRFTNLFAQLLRLAPVLPLARADAQFQPVWVGDVASAIVELIRRDGAPWTDSTVEAAGPQVLTLGGIVERVGMMIGRPRRVLALSESMGMLQASSMALLPGPTLISRDNLLSMRVPNVASGQLPGLRELGIEPRALTTISPHFAHRAAFDAWRSLRS